MSGPLSLIPIAVIVVISIAGDRIVEDRPFLACWWYGLWTALSMVLAALSAAEGSWGWAAWMALCAVINGSEWWRHNKRRKRKRAAAILGAKSKALRDALVRKVRQVAKPRPVLRPAPGGAR